VKEKGGNRVEWWGERRGEGKRGERRMRERRKERKEPEGKKRKKKKEPGNEMEGSGGERRMKEERVRKSKGNPSMSRQNRNEENCATARGAAGIAADRSKAYRRPPPAP
jgi:hypothetical protein